MCQIQSLQQKIYELKGKMSRPKLKRVKKSADDKLGALTDAVHMKADYKANLKTVKKEEEKVMLMSSGLCYIGRSLSIALKAMSNTLLVYSHVVSTCLWHIYANVQCLSTIRNNCILRTFVHPRHSIFTALLLFLSVHFTPTVLSVCSPQAERGGDRLEEECGSHVWDGGQEETFQCWTVNQQQPAALLQNLLLQKNCLIN